ncbi:SLBB domain-containing protein [Gammaproteobacteria bacterium]|nr:SLBB domain-containing protein [Gammaproteobacteria bacterium]
MINKHLITFSFFLYLFISTSFLFAQDQDNLSLNEDFLNSLPEDTRKELLEQMEEDQASLKAVDFGAFSTLIDKDIAEEYIKQELLDHEEIIEPQLLTRDALKLFGTDFFTGFPTSFMPISEPSLSSEYILDFGDSIIVEIYGPEQTSETLSISSDGAISIPSIGKVQIAGLSLNQAQIKVSDFVKSKSTGSSASISVENIRDIQIVIVGFANVPGIYTVSGNSSVLSALKVAGGIADGGSYRNIIITRNGKQISTFDLYDLLIKGDSSMNVSLKAGDVILVSPSKEIVAVYGGVKKPALFEIKDENISDLLGYVGNSIDGNALGSITHSSLLTNSLRAKEILKKDFNSIKPKGGDEIYVPYKSQAYRYSIKISGASSNSGIYSVDSANNFLKTSNFFSPSAYKLSIVHKSFSEGSNKFFYNLHNLSNPPKLDIGDELIVLDHESIDFINSKIFKEFMLTGEVPNNASCVYFDYINDIRSTSRFNLVSSFFHADNQKTKTDLNAFNVMQSDASSMDKSSNLFIPAEKKPMKCIASFNDDPELLITLLRKAILVEGKSVKSGIYPIAINTAAKDIIDAVMLQRELMPDSMISLTNNLTTQQFTLATIKDKAISPGMNLSISSQDIIMGGQVKIMGEVNKPGTYFISSQDRLSSLIDQAGGYKDSAYPIGGILIRESAKQLEKEFNDKLYNDTIKNLSSQLVQGEDIPFDAVSFVLNEFKSIEPSGRVITEFNKTLLNKNISSDLILESQDSIYIPKRSNVVYVLGEVLRPGPQSYSSSLSAKDFIEKSGGFTSSVDKSAVILVYPNGETKLIKFGIFPGNESILPGSVIYATRDFKKLNNLKLATTLAPIVSSIAISLASLNSISND